MLFRSGYQRAFWSTRCLIFPGLLLASALILQAQTPPGDGAFACSQVAHVTPTLRVEGLTELIGDIIITCAGGTPLAAGTLLPTTDLTVTLTTPVTSRTYSPDGWSEALLLIDEPLAPISGAPTEQRLCADPAHSCAIYATGTGTGTFDGSPARPNVFQGRVAGSNQIVFPNIPVDTPGPGNAHVFRIVNIRVDATNAGPGLINGILPVYAYLSTSGAASLPVAYQALTVGFVQTSLNASVRAPDGSGPSRGFTFNQCSPARQRVASLAFSEFFTTAFKPRTWATIADVDASAPGVQNIPGQLYNVESGFYNPALTGPGADFSTVGLADGGTRLRAVFGNIPPGSTVHVSTTGVTFTDGVPAAQATGYTVARLTQGESLPFAASPATATLDGIPAAALQVVERTATAVWEVLSSNLAANETFQFLVWVQPGDASPVSGSGAQFYAPGFDAPFFPRFVGGGLTYTGLFTTSDCGVRFTTAATLPDAPAGAGYDVSLAVTGGVAPYAFAVTSGSLPSGVSLSGAGVFSGAPQAVGDFSFTVTATDQLGASAARTFSIHVTPEPAAPVLTAPSDTATRVPLTPVLRWTAAAGAASYDVYIGTSSPPTFVANTASTSYSPSSLVAGTVYYWRVVTRNGAVSMPSGIWSFTTAASLEGQTIRFIPVTPCRLVDTRADQGKSGAFGPPSLAAYTPRDIPILAAGCGIPATAVAYSLNFTVVPKTGFLGNLITWPTGIATPTVSTLNAYDGRVTANAAILPVGTGGSISVQARDETDLIIDINGYFGPPDPTPGYQFHPLTPCRLVDTRADQGKTGEFGAPALAAYTPRTIPVRSGGCGVPSSAIAYSLNFTVVPKTGFLGNLITWPAGISMPTVSTLNSYDGQVTANAAIVPAGTDGAINVQARDATELIIDINGYFGPPDATPGYDFHPVTPCRLVDTREWGGKSGSFGAPSLAAYTPREIPVLSGGCGIPATAAAYSMNFTVVPQGFLGYLNTWPAGISMPTVSTLNAYDGQVTANAAIVPAGTGGAINVQARDATDMIIDINGYFGQ